MFAVHQDGTRRGVALTAMLIVLALLLTLPAFAGKDKNKKGKNAKPEPKPNILERLDYSKIVWPNPPEIARIKYLTLFYGEKYKSKAQQKKVGWMERLSGVTAGDIPDREKLRFQLVTPYGVAVDSKGRIYVADSKVRVVFITNLENGEVELIKHGVHARFTWPTGLALDDTDRLFLADPGMKRVLVFNKEHKVEATISQGIVSPGGIAVDNENRLLYVPDAELDQVLVFDADPPFKLLRKIGTGGDKEHRQTAPGDFSRPSNVAVDKEGNVYVSDTWNDRIEIFDADGTFIRTWGKAGDGPGYLARPKGIAIDSDGHVWVADTVQDRVQVFTPEGRLLIYLGGHGLLPGQFRSLTGLAIDNQNRVITSEQFPGRVQVFRYVTDAEAAAEKARREADEQKKQAEKKSAGSATPAAGDVPAAPSGSGAPAAQATAAAPK